jgi:hypothetical protein
VGGGGGEADQSDKMSIHPPKQMWRRLKLKSRRQDGEFTGTSRTWRGIFNLGTGICVGDSKTQEFELGISTGAARAQGCKYHLVNKSPQHHSERVDIHLIWGGRGNRGGGAQNVWQWVPGAEMTASLQAYVTPNWKVKAYMR